MSTTTPASPAVGAADAAGAVTAAAAADMAKLSIDAGAGAGAAADATAQKQQQKKQPKQAKKGGGCCGEDDTATAPQQQSSKKKAGSSRPKTLKAAYAASTALCDISLPYVDTHVHIPLIVEKMNAKIKENEQPVTWTSLLETLPGVYDGCVCVCCEPESFEATMAVLDEDAAAGAAGAGAGAGKMRGAFGIHPHEAKHWNDEVQAKFESAMAHPSVVAWGECGLDYYYDNSPREQQQAVFAAQMQLAVKHKKPLVVHTREAEEDTVRLMKEHLPADWPVHIHCCTSSANMVTPLLEHFSRLYVGFTGVISFGSADAVRATLRCVPLDRLLLETDGPFMAPLPFRGDTATPGHIPFVAAAMAEAKGVPLPQLLAQVRENTRALYGF